MNTVLNGLMLVDGCIQLKKPDVAASVVVGNHDDTLLKTFYWQAHGKLPDGEEYKTDAHAARGLANLKAMVRNSISSLFRVAVAEDERERKNKLEEVRTACRETNKPHELGTVAEIAQKLGISKSEVRRRKAEGTLEELFAKLV